MEFPRDVELQIIKKLDIDTRITLGIFTRLCIPSYFKNKLEEMIHKDRIKRSLFPAEFRIYLGTFPKTLQTFSDEKGFLYMLRRYIPSYGRMIFSINTAIDVDMNTVKVKAVDICDSGRLIYFTNLKLHP